VVCVAYKFASLLGPRRSYIIYVDVANCENEKVSTEINLKDYSTGCFKFACVQWLYGYELVAGTYRTLRPPTSCPVAHGFARSPHTSGRTTTDGQVWCRRRHGPPRARCSVTIVGEARSWKSQVDRPNRTRHAVLGNQNPPRREQELELYTLRMP
jgi:hypothetical protein